MLVCTWKFKSSSIQCPLKANESWELWENYYGLDELGYAESRVFFFHHLVGRDLTLDNTGRFNQQYYCGEALRANNDANLS